MNLQNKSNLPSPLFQYQEELEKYILNLSKNADLNSVNTIFTALSAKEIMILPLLHCNDSNEYERIYEISELVERKSHLLLIGPSGAGKTTLLKWLTYHYGELFLKNQEGKIPIFVRLVTYTKGTFFDHIFGYAKGISKEAFECLLEEKKLILLLDGLDQISSIGDFNPQIEMDSFFRKYDCPVVLSTRQGNNEWFQSIGEFTVAEINDLTINEIPQFIEKYDPTHEIYNSLLAVISKDKQLQSLCRNPMMLFMVITIAKETLKKGNFLPTTRSELYDQFIKFLFEHYKTRGPGKAISLGVSSEMETILEELFFSMQCNNQVSLSENSALVIISKIFGNEQAKLKLSLLVEIGILSDERGLISYGIHQSFAEYYSARKLARLFNDKKDITPAVLHPKWENVIIITSELVEDSDTFVEFILKNNATLAALCTKKISGITKDKICIALSAQINDKLENKRSIAIKSLANLGEDAIKFLLLYYESDDPIIRRDIALAFGEIKSDKTTTALLILLKDRNPSVQQAAAQSLGNLKSDNVVDAIIPLLSDSNPSIRKYASVALGEIKSEKVIDPLLPLMLDKESQVRIAVAHAVGQINAEKAIDFLQPYLKQPNILIKRYAIHSLGEIKSEKAIDTLLQLLTDGDILTQQDVIIALGKIRSYKSVDALIQIVLNNKDPTQKVAAKALGEIKSNKAINPLVKMITDPQAKGQQSAIRALGKLRSKNAVPLLLPYLSNPDSPIRTFVIRALGKIRSDKAIDALTPILADPEVGVRINVIRALGKIGSNKSVESLLPLLNDEEPRVRLRAARSLGNIKSNKAIDPLINLLSDQDPLVRRGAARALGDIESNKAIDPLINLLSDQDPLVRQAAARALGVIKSDKAVEPLICLLSDQIPTVKLTAARSLMNSCNLSQISQISELVNSNDLFIANTAFKIQEMLMRESHSTEKLDFSNKISTVWWKTNLPDNFDIDIKVLDAALTFAVELAKGYEGKPIGSAMIIGDSENVMKNSQSLCINPLQSQNCNILDHNGKHTLKYFSPLDGGFVIGGNGTIVAAGQKFKAIGNDESALPKGLGTRHHSVAAMTQITKSIGIVISESGGKISIWKDGKNLREF